MLETYNLSFSAEQINEKLDRVDFKFMGEFSNLEEAMSSLTEEGKYRVSDGEFIYTVEVERPLINQLGQSYWSTEEGFINKYYRSGYSEDDGVTWDFTDWDIPLSFNLGESLYADKNHTHYTKVTVTSFEEWINTFRAGDYRVYDKTSERYYLVSQWTYSVSTSQGYHRVQKYFEMYSPWKEYARYGYSTLSGSVATWDDWNYYGIVTRNDLTESEKKQARENIGATGLCVVDLTPAASEFDITAEGAMEISLVSYDTFAQAWWDNQQIIFMLDIDITGTGRISKTKFYPTDICIVYDESGIYSVTVGLHNDGRVFELEFTNGTWTPPV